MNNIIYNQLNKVKSVKINFNRDDTQIFIPKTTQILNTSVSIGEVYDIELSEIVLNPAESSTLSSNWNNGVIPKYNQYTVEIIDLMGNKMVKVNGVAIQNNSSQFYGWLPMDCFTIIKKY